MKNSYFVFILILFFSISTTFAQDTNDINIGKKITIQSKILNQDRDIYIHLPKNYNKYASSYPVIYVMDGNPLFYPVSGLVEVMGASQALIPEMIVVGIPNVDRYRDFMPLVDTIPNSGGADKFIAFFNEELFPYMNDNYRTDSFNILFGHSYLGLFSLYCLKKYPNTFDAYIAGSPSLNNKLLSDFMFSNDFSVRELVQNKFLYFSIGGLENKENIDKVNQFTAYLESKSPNNLFWKSDVIDHEDHDTNAIRTLLNGLNHIYPDWKNIKHIFAKGMPAIEDHYSKISDRYNYEIKVHEKIYQMIGGIFLKKGMIDKSIEVYTKYTKVHNTSYFAFNCLGKAYLANKDNEKAKQSFTKALELKPDYKDAKDNLEKI